MSTAASPSAFSGQAPVVRIWLWTYVVVGIVQVIAIASQATLLIHVTKPLLIPLVAVYGYLLARGRDFPGRRLLFVGLFFAWLGDIALMPDGTLWFIGGMLMFLIMQICYIVGFFKLGARAGLARKKWPLVVYPVFWLVANAILWPGLGDLRVPIALYSIALVVMAMTSVGVGAMLGVGGTVFMVSDLLIGAGESFGTSTVNSVAIMATYIVAQLLIVTAWVCHQRHQ